MNVVPVLQALAWGDESPLDPSGEVDVGVLARGLSRTIYAGRRRPQPYTRAQHAVVVSEAVETLAGLGQTQRRRLAVHAWLSEARNADLKDNARAGEGRQQVRLRTMDIEALAHMLAGRGRWDGEGAGVDRVALGASVFDESLRSLNELDAADRRRLSLYALLAETVLAGLGTTVAEAALRYAGLALEAPGAWIEILRLVRRMADAAVRRDLPGAGLDGDIAFPALERRIVAVQSGEAAGRWIARYRVLTEVEGERT